MQRDAQVLLTDPRLMDLVGAMSAMCVSSKKGPWRRPEVVALQARLACRIFHGISSPRLLYSEWVETPTWNRYAGYNFDALEAHLYEVL